MIEGDLKKLFIRFYFDVIEMTDFEKDIYKLTSLEEFIGVDDYLDLISIDYAKSYEKEKVKKSIKRIYDRKFKNKIHHDYAVYVAELSLMDGANIVEGCKTLSKLSIDYGYVDPVFCGYYDELQSNPDQLDFYKNRIIHDFKQLLNRGIKVTKDRR